MRSIRYLMFGKPCNVDDCLDLSNNLIPKSVNLRLDKDEIVSEMYIARRLKGIFVWKFNVSKVKVEQDFGGCFSHENEGKQKECINKANNRLEKTIKKIELHHIKIIGKGQKFDYSIVF